MLAFSPGFVKPTAVDGKPRVFISDGTRDEILPVDVCSRRIVRVLGQAGYDVEYQEFDGPHLVRPSLARLAMEKFVLGRQT